MASTDAAAAAIVARLTDPDTGTFPLRPQMIGDQTYMCFQRPRPLTLPELIDTCRSPEYASRTFIVYEGERYTFGDIIKAADEMTAVLTQRFHVKQGDRVAIAMRNYPEFAVSFLAATYSGAVAVLLNAWWTTQELEYGLSDSGSSFVICDEERMGRLLPLLAPLKLSGRVLVARPTASKPIPSGVMNMADVVALVGTASPAPSPSSHLSSSPRTLSGVHAGSRRAALGSCPSSSGSDSFASLPRPDFGVVVEPEHNATILYTSGTTAHPKGVVSTHRGIMSAINIQALNWAVGRELDPTTALPAGQQDCILLNVPLFHVTGTHVIFLPCFLQARKLIMMYKWDINVAVEYVEKEQVNIFNGVPTMSWELVHHPRLDSYDTSSLLAVGGGGAPTPPRLIGLVLSKFDRAVPNQGYGLTETNSITTSNSGEAYIKHPGSCGRPVVSVQVRIVAADGSGDMRELPRGAVGEICIRGATLMKEYWRKPDKTAEALVKDEEGMLWFRSGDIGKMDDDHFVYILDRAKDLVIRGGENISCAEVETAMYEHPSVLEVAAFGVPDERLGEEVGVAIVPKPGMGMPDVSELRSFASSVGLAKFKLPSYAFLWAEPSLPRGATGKILKREIRSRLVKRVASESPLDSPPRSKL